jgi:uncharacterized protein (DUF1697 family)
MTAYVALLRAVNLAGHKPVAMADLRGLLSALGFQEARSLLQSGNLVFRSQPRSCARLERLLEAEAEKRMALQTDFFVRTAEEWQAVVAGNPFRREAERDPSHLAVLFLKGEPLAAAVEALRAAITGREVVHVEGRQVYAVYPDGFGRSRLTTALVERKLGCRSTGRNWNTVLRARALVDA